MIPTKLTDHDQSILEKPMGETSQGLPDKSQDGLEEDGIVPRSRYKTDREVRRTRDDSIPGPRQPFRDLQDLRVRAEC